ncbi:MAG: hypothetical protein RL490_553, partial [Pseudomonadota bacterium]
KRLAKRDNAETLASLRAAGVAPSALLAGLRQHATPWPIGALPAAGQ